MMWGPYGMGYGGMFWMPFMGLLWLIVLVLIVAAVMGAFRSPERDRRERGERRSSGLAILEERYARGEINRDEYLEKRRDLLGEGTSR